MKFLILNGPNLNLMRWSEPGVPGELDYNAIMDYVQAGCEQLGIETDCCQSNHEGDLVDEIQAAAGRVDGIVLNPGAYAHYSVAILDALRLCGVPAVEVMLHAPDEREPFRKTDVVSFGCQGHFSGLALSVIATRCHLSQRERPWQYGKVSGFAKGSPFGGAGANAPERARPLP